MCVVLQIVVPMKHDLIQGSRAVSQDDVYVKTMCTSRQYQVLTSADPTVRFIVEKNLKMWQVRGRSSIQAMVVQEAMKSDPSWARRVLRIASLNKVKMDGDEAS